MPNAVAGIAVVIVWPGQRTGQNARWQATITIGRGLTRAGEALSLVNSDTIQYNLVGQILANHAAELPLCLPFVGLDVDRGPDF